MQALIERCDENIRDIQFYFTLLHFWLLLRLLVVSVKYKL